MGETGKTNKNILKISFKPTTIEEKKHLKHLRNLVKEKRHGDWNLVADKLLISRDSAEKAFLRVYSKNHFEAVKALEEIINERKQQLTQ